MGNLNKVMIIGRLGANPEIREGDNDSFFGNLSVATNSRKKSGVNAKTGATEYTDETTWHKVAVYGQNAKYAGEFLQAGSEVFIEGSLRTRSYEKDGEKKFVTEIAANKLQGIGGKSE